MPAHCSDRSASARHKPELGSGAGALDLDALRPAGRALFSIEGMWCPSCAAATERVIAQEPGVSSARVSFASGSALIRWDPATVDLPALFARIAKLGYRAGAPVAPEVTVSRIDAALSALSIRLVVTAFFGMWVMVLSLLLYLNAGGIVGTPTGFGVAAIACLAALPVVLFAGLPFFLAGWRTLIAGVPGMDALVSLGVLAAVGLSAYHLLQHGSHVYADTAVMLIAFLSIGRLIEMRTLRRAMLAIGALEHVLPERASRLLADGTSEEVPAAEVRPGERIAIAAGARVPLDGTVLVGTSATDRSVVTGESHPTPVGPGSRIEAGAVNLFSPLTVTVTAATGDRLIDRIGGRIAEVTGAKGEAQRMAETVARWVVPVAVAIAALTILGGLLVGLGAEEALLRGVSVLVIACPCAVSIAVPVGYLAFAGRAARQGILFRSPAALEMLGRVRALLFDKTGTLTTGAPEVVAVRCGAGIDEDTLRRTVAAAETGIDHPVARALAALAPVGDAAGAKRRLDRGVAADGPDGKVLIGTAELLEADGIAVPEIEGADAGLAWIEVAWNGSWIGRIAVRDSLRADAGAAVATLGARGIATAMVTGDADGPARTVAAEAGVAGDHVFAAQSPDDKVLRVQEARTRYGPVGFVGDGINDSIALAAADVGIAVEGAAHAATTVAGVVIARGGVSGVARAIVLAARARARMHQNLGFSLAYNIVGIGLAAGGAVPPIAAAAAMLASSISILINSAR